MLVCWQQRVADMKCRAGEAERIEAQGREYLRARMEFRCDRLGHKGFYSTHRTLFDRFWWPSLDQDVRWYVETCHECQLRQTTKIRIPPTVALPAPLFRKAYIDTMLMPPAAGFRYIVQACCSLSAWTEWRALRTETGRTLGAFIFEDILCRWGAVEEIVIDNGTAYVAALD
jgi:Integrase zinc binding domain